MPSGLSSLDPVHVTKSHQEPPAPATPELAAVVRQLYASGLVDETLAEKWWVHHDQSIDMYKKLVNTGENL